MGLSGKIEVSGKAGVSGKTGVFGKAGVSNKIACGIAAWIFWLADAVVKIYMTVTVN